MSVQYMGLTLAELSREHGIISARSMSLAQAQRQDGDEIAC